MAYAKSVACSHVIMHAINSNYTDMKGEAGLDLAEYQGYEYLAQGATPDMRVEGPNQHRLKCIIRPTAVKAMWVHGVYFNGYVEGWNATVVLPEDQAVHKHIRCVIRHDWGSGVGTLVVQQRKHKRVIL